MTNLPASPRSQPIKILAGTTVLKTIARIVFSPDEEIHRVHPTKADAYTNYDGQVWALSKGADGWELDLSLPATKRLYPLARI